jgi:hypothetical protein
MSADGKFVWCRNKGWSNHGNDGFGDDGLDGCYDVGEWRVAAEGAMDLE